MSDRKLGDWLVAYLEYTQKQESPEKLHLWTGLSILSAALKRQVWMQRVKYKLYTNIYVLLVADSATQKKSTAMDIGINLIRDAVPDLYYISGSMTPEGLLKHMNRVKVVANENGKPLIQFDSHVLIHADELAELFGFDRQRASRFTILLTKIYGAQAEHTHTLATEGQLLLRNLYPTLLAGTDPRNLKVLPEEAVAGLLGRLIFVTTDEHREPIAWDKSTQREMLADTLLYERLKTDLCSISQLSGEIVPTQEAKDYFEEWYVRHTKAVVEDPRIDAFRARCHDTALKIAVLLSLSQSNSMSLELQHVKKAIEYIEQQIPEFGRVAGWAVASVYAQNRARFLDTLRRQGNVGTRRQMLKLMALPLEEIMILESSLEAEHSITIRISGKNMFYKLVKEASNGKLD